MYIRAPLAGMIVAYGSVRTVRTLRPLGKDGVDERFCGCLFVGDIFVSFQSLLFLDKRQLASNANTQNVPQCGKSFWVRHQRSLVEDTCYFESDCCAQLASHSLL